MAENRFRETDNDVFIRRNGQPNVDLKAGAMAMLMARRDYGYAATCNTFIVRF
jgi:hypothetical protein